MAMKTLYLKEHEGMANSPIGQLSSMPWWSTYGSQSVCGGSEQLNATKTSGEGNTGLGVDKEDATMFIISSGDCKTSGDGLKTPQKSSNSQMPLPESHAQFGLGLGQPVMYANCPPPFDQCYGMFPAYGPQVSGRIMLPMRLNADDGPIYVNAKQYRGIIRRRKSRAMAENKVTKKRKPYMHYSRHLHALRRPRGSGGRFLNTKVMSNGKGESEAKKLDNFRPSQPTGSQSSEVLQSNSGTLNSPKEANGSGRSNISACEVTSIFSRAAECERFTVYHLSPSIHALPGMRDSERGSILIPSGLQQITTATQKLDPKNGVWCVQPKI